MQTPGDSPVTSGNSLLRSVDASFAAHVLTAWSWLLPTRHTVIGMSLFGDLFLIDDVGVVYMLDLVAGERKQIAYCIEEFNFESQRELPQNEWFMADLAQRLSGAGLALGPTECYGFRTLPMLGGQLTPENVTVMDARLYHTGLSDITRRVRDLPPGTEVVFR